MSSASSLDKLHRARGRGPAGQSEAKGITRLEEDQFGRAHRFAGRPASRGLRPSKRDGLVFMKIKFISFRSIAPAALDGSRSRCFMQNTNAASAAAAAT